MVSIAVKPPLASVEGDAGRGVIGKPPQVKLIVLELLKPTPVMVIASRTLTFESDRVICRITVKVAVSVFPKRSVALTVCAPGVLEPTVNWAKKLPVPLVWT